MGELDRLKNKFKDFVKNSFEGLWVLMGELLYPIAGRVVHKFERITPNGNAKNKISDWRRKC